jgi:hypothetical protein
LRKQNSNILNLSTNLFERVEREERERKCASKNIEMNC